MTTGGLQTVVATLWRGQYGLAKTWWLVGLVGTMLLNLVSGPLNAAVAATPPDGIGGIALRLAALLVGAFGIIYGVIVTVAIVRAATAYSGRRLWPRLTITATAAAWLGALMFVAF